MPVFTYCAKDTTGHSQKGNYTAPSLEAARSALRNEGLLLLELREAKHSAPAQKNILQPSTWLWIRSIDVELSLQPLAVMLKSGVTLLKALQIISKQSTRKRMERVWERVSEDIQGGSSFAQALEKHRCFNHLTLQLVHIGEQTGRLELVLRQAAQGIEQQRQLRNHILNALAYPTVVLVAALGVTIFMLVSVIPRIETFLRTLGRPLPPLTQSLVDLSAGITLYWPLFLTGSVFIFLIFLAIYSNPQGRKFLDRQALRLPIFGRLFRLSGTILFARVMSMMLGSGLTILESLRTASQLHYNRSLAEQVDQVREQILRGGSLSESLAQGSYMPMLASMVEVGEASGTLEELLQEVAVFHEAQLQWMIRWLSTLVEPLIIILIGGVVGFVYTAFFVAILGGVGLGK
jgi:type IV pilus assembly protein PilC